MSTSRNTLKNWFVTLAKPLQSQYWAWLDSYWHKDDIIPVSRVENLTETLNAIGAIAPLAGTKEAGFSTIVLPAGRMYTIMFLTGTGVVSVGLTEGGTELLDSANIAIIGEENYALAINKKRSTDITLYITNTNSFTYEIYRH